MFFRDRVLQVSGIGFPRRLLMLYSYGMKKGMLFFWLFVLILVIGTISISVLSKSATGKLDSFAACIAEKNATFYGAFWCPHCQAQKRMFGASQQLLPYHECSTPDGKGQRPECTELKIEQYPTWVFADGSRLTGEVTLANLAEKTGCELPQ